MLAEKFKIKDLGRVRHFLGIHFQESDEWMYNDVTGKVHKKVLQHFIIQNCRTREAPHDQKLEYTHGSVKMTLKLGNKQVITITF